MLPRSLLSWSLLLELSLKNSKPSSWLPPSKGIVKTAQAEIIWLKEMRHEMNILFEGLIFKSVYSIHPLFVEISKLKGSVFFYENTY
jgi:hypothetical protein